MIDLRLILSHFQAVVACPGGRWRVRCPFPERHRNGDRTPSCRLWLGRDGRMLAGCYGCGAKWKEITERVELPMAAWFPDNERPLRNKPMRQEKIVATYDYRDARGELSYQVVRYEPKDFRQRRPAVGRPGAWEWNLEGVIPMPYRLPELLASDREKDPVLIVEGEKDVETLRELGFVATCNSGGAGNWRSGLGVHLRGRRCVILPDFDEAGFVHARLVAAELLTHDPASIRLVHRPSWFGMHKDVSEWLEKEHRSDPVEFRRKRVIHLVMDDSREYKLTGAMAKAAA